MLQEYKDRLKLANDSKKAIARTSKKLRKMRKGVADDLIHPMHEEAFEQIDCLKCANCCKTTGPLFTERDINRISKHLGMKTGDFYSEYLRIDEDEDYVLKQVPCTFLGDDNMCSIYDVRPKACAEYPHTDQVNQIGQLTTTLKNTSICPAVADIFANLIKVVDDIHSEKR